MPDMRIVSDGQNNTPIIAAHVKSLPNANALAVTLMDASGDQATGKTENANYGRKNVTTAATIIIPSNPNRRGFLIQNLERQQVAYGYNSNLTVANSAGFIHPTANNSGDGGVLQGGSVYIGAIYGIVASGDNDLGYAEF